uniref:Ankyrin repeat domain 52 n=1 Tax=Petromyzon marinus TaxID=7757 RepID=S4RRT2_PETMA
MRHAADVNARDKNWQTPLHVASANRAIKCADALIPLLSNVNVSDRAGRTALHHAAFNGNLEMVNLLISKGANVNAMDKRERRAVHWAGYMGHTEVVKMLLSNGADVNWKDKKGYTPLHAAAASGHVTVVRLLLSLKAEMNEFNGFGNTALHVACHNGQDAVVSELLDAGADAGHRNERGFTALHFAAASTHGAICLELLVNHHADVNAQSYDGKSPLHMTAIHGRFTRSQTLIQNGGEIDCGDKEGNTPLHIAARYGHELLINTLISNGADAARRGSHGMFPLHLAALSGFSDCCRKLLTPGFDVDAVDEFGRTCLHAAAAGGNAECINLLLSSGADLGKKDRYGSIAFVQDSGNSRYSCNVRTIAMRQSYNQHSHDTRICEPLICNASAAALHRCLEHLLQNGAEPALRDKQGYTAAHYAAAFGHRLCLELVSPAPALQQLLDMAGAELLRDPDSRSLVSPLHLAAYHGHHQALEVLLRFVGEADLRDGHGRAPLELAAARGHTECVETLLANGACAGASSGTAAKRCPLHSAGGSAVAELLTIGKSRIKILGSINLFVRTDRTPLMLAVTNGHTDCVLLLMDKGANPDAVDLQKHTALHRGVRLGPQDPVMNLVQISVVRRLRPHHPSGGGGCLLFSRPVLPQAPTNLYLHSQRALCKIYYNSHEACVELLLEQLCQKFEGNPFTPLHCAVMNDNESCAEMLIDAMGAKIVMCQDGKGRTPLHAAAFADNVECAQLLLSHGARVDATDRRGRTPLMTGALQGQSGIVEYLVNNTKGDLSLTDDKKNTALHLACGKGHETCALLLLEKVEVVALIDCPNRNQHTPLHLAARNGLSTVVQDLLSKGASVLALDENGHTPALACAPNKDVADCLALILATMMPL